MKCMNIQSFELNFSTFFYIFSKYKDDINLKIKITEVLIVPIFGQLRISSITPKLLFVWEYILNKKKTCQNLI